MAPKRKQSKTEQEDSESEQKAAMVSVAPKQHHHKQNQTQFENQSQLAYAKGLNYTTNQNIVNSLKTLATHFQDLSSQLVENDFQTFMNNVEHRINVKIEGIEHRMHKEIQNLHTKLDSSDVRAFARLKNSFCLLNESFLTPLPNLKTGLYPSLFPATKYDLLNLSVEQVDELLEFYGVPRESEEIERRTSLRIYIGVP